MLFWPILFTGALVLASFMAATPGPDGVPPDDTVARYVFAVTAGLAVVVGVTLRLMGRRAVWAAPLTVGLVGMVLAAPGVGQHASAVWDRVRGAAVPSLALSHRAGEVELRRAWDGHYRADTHVNGVPMRMMVDTGASMILIPFEAVGRLGIDPRSLDYSVPVSTANGPSAVAPLRLATVEIGPIRVADVEAAVARPGRLQTPLLGMSFLERLSETSFRGDRLILRLGHGGEDTYFVAPPGRF